MTDRERNDLTLGLAVDALAAHEPTDVPATTAPRRAAVAIVLRENGNGVGPEALFIQRVEHPQDPWSGQMAFPGGHVDEEDADAVAAAVREAHEEVGLHLDRDARFLGRLDDLQAVARGKLLPMAITPAVFALEREVRLRRAPEEVADVVWLPLRALATGPYGSTIEVTRRVGGPGAGGSPVTFTLPCWRIEERCIWGLTYLMTCSLFRVLGWNGLPDDPRREGNRVGWATGQTR